MVRNYKRLQLINKLINNIFLLDQEIDTIRARRFSRSMSQRWSWCRILGAQSRLEPVCPSTTRIIWTELITDLKCDLWSKFWGACSRLYRSRFSQPNIRWKALDEIYQIYILLHVDNPKISVNSQYSFEKSQNKVLNASQCVDGIRTRGMCKLNILDFESSSCNRTQKYKHVKTKEIKNRDWSSLW